MKKIHYLIIGTLVGLTIPLLVDWIMFGTISPCDTTSTQSAKERGEK